MTANPVILVTLPAEEHGARVPMAAGAVPIKQPPDNEARAREDGPQRHRGSMNTPALEPRMRVMAEPTTSIPATTTHSW